MSTYCTICGQLEYEDEDAFNLAAGVLQRGFWTDAEGWFVGEDGERIGNCPSVEPSTLTITIPCSLYRNLGGVLDQLLFGSKHDIVWTCSDGCFEGGHIVDGKEVHFDFSESVDFLPIDEEDREAPDLELEPDEYWDWQQMIEQAFFQYCEAP